MADPQVTQILRDLEALAERSIKKITLDITANLIQSTPVDTGWARANWIPSITTAFQGTDGTREEAESGSVSTGKQLSGQAQVLSYRLAQGQVFVTNNVPYILRLNDGSSTQAPSGFIGAAVLKAVLTDILGLAT